MEEFLKNVGNFFVNTANNWLIGGLFLIASALLGFLLTHIAWRNLVVGKKKNGGLPPQEISQEVEWAQNHFKSGNTDFKIEKVGFFVGALVGLLEKIPAKYGDGKLYEVLDKEKTKVGEEYILTENLKLNLDFTVFELVYFLRCFSQGLNREILKFLNDWDAKIVYNGARIFGKKAIGELPKNAEDTTIAQLIDIISKLSAKKDEPNGEGQTAPPDNKIKAFFGGIADKVKGVISGAVNAVKNIGVSYANKRVDDFACAVIALFAEEINKLYSEQFKSQISQIPQTDCEKKESA